MLRVDEPSSCSYVITVHTNKLCHHSLFRPSPAQKPQAITCSPALSEERYKTYIERIGKSSWHSSRLISSRRASASEYYTALSKSASSWQFCHLHIQWKICCLLHTCSLTLSPLHACNKKCSGLKKKVCQECYLKAIYNEVSLPSKCTRCNHLKPLFSKF